MAIIPCIHNNEGRNSPESYDRLNVRILYKDVVHLVYMHDARCHYIAANRSLSSNPLNPFCSLCKTDVLDNFSSNSFSNYSISHIDKVFERLQERVDMIIRKFQHLNDKDGQGGNNTKLKAGRVYSYVLPVERHRDLYYSDPLEIYSYFWNWDGASTQPRPTPASKLAIEELVRVEVTADHGRNEARFIEEDCVVCLQGLAKEAGAVVLVRLPCEHVFHEECVVQWLRTSHFCPLCRFELPVEASE